MSRYFYQKRIKMDDFAEIETYDAADETINFGSRCVSEGDSLYEAVTTCLLKSSNCNIDNLPLIHTTLKDKMLIFAIGHTLRIFEDLTCSNLVCNSKFDSTIDAFCSSKNYLLICLRNGSMYLLDITTSTIIVSGKAGENVWIEEQFYINAFEEEYNQVEGELKFLVVDKNGVIKRITFKIPAEGEKTFSADTILELHIQINNAAKSHRFMLLNGKDLVVVDLLDGSCIKYGGCLKLKKIYPFDLTSFIALTDDGKLMLICRVTLIMHYFNTDVTYTDFVFVNKNNEKNCVLIKEYDEFGKSSIDSVTLPDFDCVYSIQISGNVKLVQPDCVSHEQIYFSFLRSKEIKIQMICETIPEKRLARLLRKQLFSEAEEFATKWNLDMQDIKKAKARIIMSNPCLSEDNVSELIAVLDTVHDTIFKQNCCIEVATQCYEHAHRLLTYGAALKSKATEDMENVMFGLGNIFNAMYKLEMFELSKETEMELNESHWTDFYNSNLYEYLCMQLNHGKIESSIIIYTRLINSTIVKFESRHIEDIISIVNTKSLDVITPFMCVFIKNTLLNLPETVTLFYDWVREKLFGLEYNSDFPENGIEFANEMIKLFNVDYQNPEKYHKCRDILGELCNIIKSLQTLQLLKNNYSIPISLKDCLLGPLNLVQALRGIYIEYYEEFLDEFLVKYLIKNNLDPDEIFVQEIEEMLEYEEEVWINVVPLLWKHICSVEKKLNAVFLILKHSNLPRSPQVLEILSQAMQYQHPLVASIEIEIKNEPFYKIWRDKLYKLEEHFLLDRIVQKKNIFDYISVINRIIHFNEPSMLEDIYTVCLNEESKREANFSLLKHFLENGEIARALTFVTSQTNEECLAYLEILIVHCNYLFDWKNKYISNQLRENYIKMLDPIFGKAIAAAESWKKPLYEERRDAIKATMLINNKLITKVNPTDLDTERRRESIFDLQLLEEIVENFLDSKTDILTTILFITKLTNILNLNTEITIVKFCSRITDLKALYKAAAYLYKYSSDAVALSMMTALVLKTVDSDQIRMLGDSSEDLDSSQAQVDINMINEIFVLARKMAAKAINCKENGEAVEVFNWANYILFGLSSPGQQVDGVIFPNRYTEDASCIVVDAVRTIFDMYTNCIASTWNPNIRILTYFNQPKEENADHTLNELCVRLTNIIQSLNNDRKYFTACNMLTLLQNSLLSLDLATAEMENQFRELLDQSVLEILKKVFGAKKIDETVAINLLQYFNFNKAKKLLRQALAVYKKDVDKFNAVAKIGIWWCNYHGTTENLKVYKDIVLLVKWWKIIENCTIPYENFFRESRNEILEKLIYNHLLSIEQIKDFCVDFSLEVVRYYYIFLKKTLVNWKPTYKIEHYITGKRVIHIEEENLFEDCMKLINRLILTNDPKESIFNFISSLTPLVNVYHYEVFVCIFKLLKEMNKNIKVENKIHLLMFLQKYTRFSKPGESEKEEWSTLFPDSQCLDVFSEWRLPFTSTLFSTDIWNILRTEVNLNNYVKWFEILPVFNNNLNKVDICSFVIKELVKREVLQSETNTNWVFYPRHTDLFQEIDMCITNITDLERATSVAYYVTTNTPPGADQVNAAKLAYKYATLYKEAMDKYEDKENVYKAYKKIQLKYYNYSTMHILHVNGLADEKYLKMINQPKELIEALYFDDRITKTGTVLHCPDINKAVDEIAALYSIDIVKKRTAMLESLLSDGIVVIPEMDESILITPEVDKNLDKNENLYLKRASYICTGGDLSYWQNYLVKRGLLDDVTPSLTRTYQVRALRCLCMISTVEKIEELTDSSYEAFLYFIERLSLLDNLTSLGVNLDINLIHSYKPNDLLKKVLKTVISPVSLKVMKSICQLYLFYDLKYWEIIIVNMIKLNMCEDIKLCINFLKKECLLNQKFYINAWQYVINNSFEKLLQNYDDAELHDLCVLNMHQLQSCPVSYQLNMEKVFSICVQINKYEFAAVLLQYIPAGQRENLVKSIFKNCSMPKSALVTSVKKLLQYGLLGTQNVIDIINELV